MAVLVPPSAMISRLLCCCMGTVLGLSGSSPPSIPAIPPPPKYQPDALNLSDFKSVDEFLEGLGLPAAECNQSCNCSRSCACEIRTFNEEHILHRVRSIEIKGCNLTGKEIRPELLQLEHLERLVLAQNRLSGPMPRHFPGCRKLSSLDLSGNSLTGAIVLENYLDGRSRMRQLVLSNNLLNGPIPAIKTVDCELRELRLAGNRLSGAIPPQLLNMKNLKILSLAGNKLNGSIPEVWQESPMEQLFLEENELQGEIPDSIANMNSLAILRLEINFLEGKIPESLGQLRALEQLRLNHNRLHGVPWLGQLDHLSVLQLNDLPLKSHIPGELGNLTRLEFLDLSNSGLHGSIKHLATLTGLRSLRLMKNDLGGELPDFAAPNLTTVLLDRNHFSGDVHRAFCQAPQLLTLSLHHNQLSGPLPECLGDLANLEQLFLHHNIFVGEVPEGLADLQNLTVITLHSNHFRGRLPKLKRSSVATFHSNDFSGSIPEFDFKHSCSNSPWFSLHGADCEILEKVMVREKIVGCNELQSIHKMNISELLQQCPETCGTCSEYQLKAKLTLHGNRLSGPIPPSVNSSEIQATALMGNTLGDGEALNADWLSLEDAHSRVS